MRNFIRHPSDIPIEFDLSEVVQNKKEYLNNLSEGGLCFKSKYFIEKGSVINIRIPLFKPLINIKSFVAWCTEHDGYYDVGVEFLDIESEFRARMVEQVCYIEHFKKEMREKEGREVSGEEAALEWIRKYAKNFPD